MKWYQNAIFYHLYPLGMLDCEKQQIYQTQHRLPQLLKMIPKIKRFHVNAVYIGPIFQSSSHGYDTIDYQMIDQRLGDINDFKQVVEAFHQAQIKVVVDAVFHHVGRDFFAFQDVLKHREQSKYINWFCHIDFRKDNAYHDGFCYDTWKGAIQLVKLNLANVDVQNYIMECIQMWIDVFHIDGLRLDAAECMIFPFFEWLHFHLKKKDPNFYLMGEVVFGDYQQWIYPYRLDSITNYELYHALHHAHNSNNYHELAHTLNRQFGKEGLYRSLFLYNFVDNHDVHRIMSLIKDKNKVKNIYTLLFSVPGVPSIYYGSEYGIKGRKQYFSDEKLRPALDLSKKRMNDLAKHIQLLAHIRLSLDEFQNGTFESLYCSEGQFIFIRKGKEKIYICVNQDKEICAITGINLKGEYIDLLTNQSYTYTTSSKLCIQGYGAMILKQKKKG